MTEHEIWKDVKGYENLYQVSSYGRVRRISKNNKLLKLNNTNKYLRVSLSKDGEVKVYKVHQLVAIVFLNHIPNKGKLVVDHIDNNPLNNKLSNLQIISNRENISKNRVQTTSKFTGVHWNKTSKKWIAQITINKERKNLGSFSNEIEAHKAYNKQLKLIKND